MTRPAAIDIGGDVVSWNTLEHTERGIQLRTWRTRALLLAACGVVALIALASSEGSSNDSAGDEASMSARYAFQWHGTPSVMIETASKQGAAAGSGHAQTNKLVDCVGFAFGHDCDGPRGHDHGWMKHEQDCIDASKHDWEYTVTNRTSTGVGIGTLIDPGSGKCLTTRKPPYLGSMWLEDCQKGERTQLWSKTVHQNHVFGFGYGESDVTEYFNAADSAAVDINCQGKCFRQRVCLDSALYKKWVHDSDIPQVPFPDKIPDDPLAPI